MTALIWLLPLAALLLGLKLRSGRIHRSLICDLRAEVKRLQRLARYRGLQNATERARTRQAETDAAEWAGIARAWMERLVSERERAELLARYAAVSTVEDGLREIGAGS